MRIRITCDNTSVDAELRETGCAHAIANALPIVGEANRCGDELYLRTDVTCGLDPDARSDMEPGEIAYWPPGQMFCIFLGQTPASEGSAPKAASDVNPIGRIVDDPCALDAVREGLRVRIEAVD